MSEFHRPASLPEDALHTGQKHSGAGWHLSPVPMVLKTAHTALHQQSALTALICGSSNSLHGDRPVPPHFTVCKLQPSQALKNNACLKSFGQAVANEGRAQPGSQATRSWLPGIGFGAERAISPAERADNASHFPPPGLAVKQGVSLPQGGVCEEDGPITGWGWPVSFNSRRDDAEGCDRQGDRRRVTGGRAARGLALGHLDPLGHVLEDGVHGLQGVFPLRRRGAVVVALHVDALVVYGGQVGAAIPGGSRGRVSTERGPTGPTVSTLTQLPAPGRHRRPQTCPESRKAVSSK